MAKVFTTVTHSIIPAPVSGNAPAWALALPINQWSTVATTNQMVNLDPKYNAAENPSTPSNPSWEGNSGYKGVFAYSGGALAIDIGVSGKFICWGGGHTDYYGNSVQGLDLETRTWERYTSPYPTSSSFSEADGWYPAVTSAPGGYPNQPNGSPPVPHTYGHVQYSAPLKSFVSMRAAINNGGGNSSNIVRVSYFPLDTNPKSWPVYEWQRGDLGSAAPSYQDGWGCLDTTRNIMWAHGGAGNTSATLFRSDLSAGSSQGAYGPLTETARLSSASGQAATYDPLLDKVIVYDGTTPRFRGVDPTAVTTLVTLPTSGLVAVGAQGGMEFAPTLSANLGTSTYIMWSNGSNIYRITKGSGAWNAATYTFTQINTGPVSSNPIRHSSGTYGRFRVATYSDAEFAIMIPEPDLGIFYVFRLA